MSRIAGPGTLSGLSRLSGGANMESWAFEWAGEGYVLRRAPSAAYMADRPFGHVDEAALVMAAFDAGVKAPEVVGVLEAGDGLRSEEHTSELQSRMRISYGVFCLKKKNR